MQMKFLTVALATALTATLTGCGGDGDSTYNKQTAVPIDAGSSASQDTIKKLKDNLSSG